MVPYIIKVIVSPRVNLYLNLQFYLVNDTSSPVSFILTYFENYLCTQRLKYVRIFSCIFQPLLMLKFILFLIAIGYISSNHFLSFRNCHLKTCEGEEGEGTWPIWLLRAEKM